MINDVLHLLLKSHTKSIKILKMETKRETRTPSVSSLSSSNAPIRSRNNKVVKRVPKAKPAPQLTWTVFNWVDRTRRLAFAYLWREESQGEISVRYGGAVYNPTTLSVAIDEKATIGDLKTKIERQRPWPAQDQILSIPKAEGSDKREILDDDKRSIGSCGILRQDGKVWATFATSFDKTNRRKWNIHLLLSSEPITKTPPFNAKAHRKTAIDRATKMPVLATIPVDNSLLELKEGKAVVSDKALQERIRAMAFERGVRGPRPKRHTRAATGSAVPTRMSLCFLSISSNFTFFLSFG